jgi:hypothetical protein
MTGTMDGGVIQLGHPLLDAYLELVAARARTNTLLAQAQGISLRHMSGTRKVCR